MIRSRNRAARRPAAVIGRYVQRSTATAQDRSRRVWRWPRGRRPGCAASRDETLVISVNVAVTELGPGL